MCYPLVLKCFYNIFKAKHLDAGNSLESFTTTCEEKSLQGTRLIAEPNGKKVKELDNPQART